MGSDRVVTVHLITPGSVSVHGTPPPSVLKGNSISSSVSIPSILAPVSSPGNSPSGEISLLS